MNNLINMPFNRSDGMENNEVAPTMLGIKIFKYIKKYYEKNDIPPTQQEIMDELKTTKNGLRYAVQKLIDCGMIKKRGATRNLYPTL